MPIAERLGRALGWLWRAPCKLMLATIVLCAATREWYPFSPFPMYANFSPTTWYVCVTDAAGRPLPTEPYLGLEVRPLRRMFETRVLARTAAGATRAEAEAAVAPELLRFVLREARPADGAPRLPDRIDLRRIVTRIDGQHLARYEDTLGAIGGE